MQHLCYHPWVGLDISAQGEFKPCCKYNKSLGSSLEEYEGSPELQNLKQDFLNGIKPIGCQRCWLDEDSGLPSKRTIDNIYLFKNQSPDLKSYKALNLSFGNTCNLSCRTCDGYASSKWAQDEEKLQKQFPNIVIYKHNKFYRNNEFMSSIKDISSNLINVQFFGGESFIAGIAEQLEFLDYLIEKNSKEISLTYITNTTTFPEQEFWSRWVKFKNVDIQLSIDGTKDQFEYIRWPASWEECYNNIKRYQSYIRLYDNVKLSISHTISVFNVFYLPEFFTWCLKEQLPEPYMGMVSDPPHYSIKVLPKNIKQKIKEKLTMKKFLSVVEFMGEESTADFTKTIDWIKSVDSIRNQKFLKTFPELDDYINYFKE